MEDHDISDPPDRLRQAVENAWPPLEWGEDIVLIGVSGGIDSVALLCTIASMAADQDRVKVIHCNHQLRGEESDRDESFVIDYCLELGVECLAVRLSDAEVGEGSEQALRRARYHHFEQAANAFGARWIAMGHHLDDNIETILHRLLRGTGVRGLAGIPPRRPFSTGSDLQIVRPFLELSRATIAEWAEQRSLPFRIDSSNSQENYTRNRLRLQLIPVLDRLGGDHWRERVQETILQLRSLDQRADLELDELIKRGVFKLEPNGGARFSLVLAQLTPWPKLREMFVELWNRQRWSLRPMTAKHWNGVRQLLEEAEQTTHPKRLQLPSGIRVEVRQGQVRFYQSSPEIPSSPEAPSSKTARAIAKGGTSPDPKRIQRDDRGQDNRGGGHGPNAREHSE